jgi:hypothetical protein
MTKFVGCVVVTGTVALTVAAGTAHTPRDSGGPPDLHGTWALNRNLSDKAPTIPNDGAGRSDGPDGFGGGGRFGGGGGFGGRGMPPSGGMPPGGGSIPDPEQMKKMRAVMDELMQAVDRFTIVQPEPTVVTIIDADGHTRTFSVSGKKEPHQLQSATVDVQSRWDGAALRQEISTGSVHIVRTFVRDVERNRLTVTVASSDSRRALPPIKRVYDGDER